MNVRVRIEDIGELDGYIEYCDGQYVARLSSKSIPSRRRFTLGHELCHMLLMEDAKRGVTVNLPRYRASAFVKIHQDPEEEALCNIFAAELLMPRDEVRKIIAGYPTLSCNLIEKTSSLFDVSFHAAATSLVTAYGRNYTGAALWKNHSLPRWPLPIWWVGLRTTTRKQLAKIESVVRNTYASGKEQLWNTSHFGRSCSHVVADSSLVGNGLVLTTFRKSTSTQEQALLSEEFGKMSDGAACTEGVVQPLQLEQTNRQLKLAW